MLEVVDKSFNSANNVEKATIVKSFKYGAAKDTNQQQLETVVGDLVSMIQDKDLSVKKNALEALNSVVHNHPNALRGDTLENLQRFAFAETVIKPELITEIDLGPFKHRVDEGIPIRKAAFSLIDSLVEKLPGKVDNTQIIELSIRGIDDSAEECMILSLHILGRLTVIAPTLVLSCIEAIVDAFDKQFQKNLKMISNVQSSERAQNIMRAILRVVEQLQRTPDIETSPKFSDFFKVSIAENANAKDMYEKIAATAS